MNEVQKNIPINSNVENLYAAREKIFPREVKGRFQTIRSACVLVLLGIYYLAPWLQWNGRQAILFDLPARKFHIFNLTLWPQDFIFLTLLLILAGLSLFFFTAIAGRVWCGYACPQTVWTEAFIRMERWVEGTRAQQMKLDAMPWNLQKLRKKITKQFLWISFALLTGLTFVGYFYPIQSLVVDLVNFDLSGWILFWVIFYGFATYGNAGFMREQVCKYMCPYARFQSAMFDKDTLIVAYDEKRGEPRSRGKKRKQELADSVSNTQGDCIDCSLCVQVCPTGIDIRDGLQYECIACAACIDACDEVMERIDLPTGLIRYSSEKHDQGAEFSIKESLLRPRIIIYACLLAAVFIGFVSAIAMRSSFQVDILRDRNALYRWSDQQTIENSYQIKVMNKSQQAQQYSVDVVGLDGSTVAWGGLETGVISELVPAGEMGDFNLVISMPANEQISGSKQIELIFSEQLSEASETITEETRFWGPH